MKKLKDYLTESKKTYRFKVGIAGDLPEGINERLKNALEKFSVESLSSGKKTPIQERPLDFPNLENVDVTYWDVEVNYPTTDAVLKEYIGTFCSVHRSHVVVRNPDSPASMEKEEPTASVYQPLLTTETLDGVSAQGSVGTSRVMDLLKELEVAKKESGFKMETTDKELQNKSVLGN